MRCMQHENFTLGFICHNEMGVIFISYVKIGVAGPVGSGKTAL